MPRSHTTIQIQHIETHDALKTRILRFSFGFGDLSIDMSLENAAQHIFENLFLEHLVISEHFWCKALMFV